MGLDSVELIIAWEEAFGVEVTDTAAASMHTPRDVIEYFAAHLPIATEAPCIDQQAFHLTRTTFVSGLGVERAMVHPNTPLAALLPSQERKQTWERLGALAGVSKWPRLVRPLWLVLALTGISVVGGAAVFFVTRGEVPTFVGVVLGAAIVLCLGWIFERITRVACQDIPKQLSTVWQLVEALVVAAPRDIKKSAAWTRQQIEIVVRRITLDQLGAVDYDLDKRFVQDMGVD